ncbi:hypothetical protein KDK77_09220, partial [bacterium]|nr:hypothetical protein [bacterium]
MFGIRVGVWWVLLYCALPIMANENLERTFFPQKYVRAVPAHNGIIDHISNETADKSVFLIRDIHAHYEAQKNCVAIINALEQSYGSMPCYVEGYEGNMDFSPFGVFRDAQSKKKVGDYYLKNGKISGEEYSAIVSSSVPNIFGLENRELYESNRKVFKEIISSNQVILQELEGVRYSIVTQNTETEKILAEFDRFLHETHDPCTFLALCNIQHPALEINSDAYPELARYMQAQEIRKNIDSKVFEEEHREILQLIENRLPDALKTAFGAIKVHYTMKQIAQDRFEGVVISLLQGMNFTS